MKARNFTRRAALVPLGLGLVLALGCLAERGASLSDQQLFEAVKTGMSRAGVEKRLGKPVAQLGNKVYYGKPPRIEKWQSPPAPGSILIVYSTNNVVQSKKLFRGYD